MSRSARKRIVRQPTVRKERGGAWPQHRACALFLRCLIASAVACFFALGSLAPAAPPVSSCVWKVTAPDGGTAYLGGSIHALRRTDYPLPAAFNRALNASERLVLEVDQSAYANSTRSMMLAGLYPRADSLRNHVDPRTYAAVRRIFATLRVPEAEFSHFRPWYIVLNLQTPGSSRGVSGSLGVEQYLLRRAHTSGKPVSGLETLEEHLAVFSGLNDQQSELLLLFTLMPQAQQNEEGMPFIQAWRNGDADEITSMMREGYREFPSFADRLLGMRNRRWIPKIEGYLHSGHTYFVVAGAAHFGGPDGVLALLRARGYQITQM